MAKTTNKKTTVKVTKKPVAVKVKKTQVKKISPVKSAKVAKITKVAPQKTATKKIATKSTHKKFNFKVIQKVIILLLAISALTFGVIRLIKKNNFSLSKKGSTFTFVSKDGKEKVDLKLKIADTDPSRLKGLQGVKKLEEKTGMLFDFEEPGYYSMWMKGMDIPLDMVFLNNYGKVLVVAENRPANNEDLITPCSVAYDKLSTKAKKNVNEDKFFENCENKYLKYQNLTRYVIEIPAGSIKKYNIMTGDVLLKK